MKKKYPVTSKDKKEWLSFTKSLRNIYDKDTYYIKQNTKINKTQRLDLHGFSLNQANKIVKEFIIKAFETKCKKILIITGKGLRSKISNNPYLSEKMNVLKYSVPEFIKNDEDLVNKISRISEADLKDGGEGALYVFLKQAK